MTSKYELYKYCADCYDNEQDSDYITETDSDYEIDNVIKTDNKELTLLNKKIMNSSDENIKKEQLSIDKLIFKVEITDSKKQDIKNILKQEFKEKLEKEFNKKIGVNINKNTLIKM